MIEVIFLKLFAQTYLGYLEVFGLCLKASFATFSPLTG